MFINALYFMDIKIKNNIRQLHIEFAESRGLHATYCPSEVARKLEFDHWRELMDDVRRVADILIEENILVVLQNGDVIKENATQAIGPIRLRKKN